jgi:hypothetical protein
MEHLSDWHALNPAEPASYPRMARRVQVRFRDGRTEEGNRARFFPATILLPHTQISAWRYIKGDIID